MISTKNHSGGGALHRLATLVGHTPAKENAEGQALILSNTSMSPYTTPYRLPHHIFALLQDSISVVLLLEGGNQKFIGPDWRVVVCG